MFSQMYSFFSYFDFSYVYNQILSILTLTQLTRIFDQYNNFDLRRLLSGSERLINNLVDFTENDPAFFFNAVECLPLASSARDVVVQAITSSCQKIKVCCLLLLIFHIHVCNDFNFSTEFIVRHFTSW